MGKESVRERAATVRIPLGGTQTIREVAELRSRLTELLGGSGEVALEGGGLERVDTAFIQLLTAFRRDAAARGIQVSWDGMAPEVVRIARLLGLEDELAIQKPVLQEVEHG